LSPKTAKPVAIESQAYRVRSSVLGAAEVELVISHYYRKSAVKVVLA
jgi:hypothetical protein